MYKKICGNIGINNNNMGNTELTIGCINNITKGYENIMKPIYLYIFLGWKLTDILRSVTSKDQIILMD